MTQLYFTLDHDFLVDLFSENKGEAYGKLTETLLNQVLQAESSEQLGDDAKCHKNDRKNLWHMACQRRSAIRMTEKIYGTWPVRGEVP